MRPAILLGLLPILALAAPASAHAAHRRAHAAPSQTLRGRLSDTPAPAHGRKRRDGEHGSAHETKRERRAREAEAREAQGRQARAERVAGERRAAALAARRLLGPPPAPRLAREIILEDGESLADAAARIGVSAAALAKLNGLDVTDEPATGQRLRLPPPGAGAPATRLAADTPRTSSSEPSPGAASGAASVGPTTASLPSARPYRSLGPEGVGAPASAPAASRRGRTEADAMAAYAVASTRAPSLAGRSDAVHTRFTWPVRGQVLSAFGAGGLGRRNDGVDLAARPGDPVRAAAAGEVVYAGKEIAGSGSLVLLKHADGWVTAYAKLGRVTVAMRQTVDQGQEIGEAGASTTFEAPRLHFEVRAPSPTGAKPVDPAGVLPPA